MSGKPARPYGRGLSINTVVRLTPPVVDEVKRLAAKCGKSFSDWVREAIDEKRKRDLREQRRWLRLMGEEVGNA